MTKKPDPKSVAQGKRLAAAREAAGFRSSRAAAIQYGWPESTYRAHEGGSRTIGQDDAERYTARFRSAGVRVTAKDILFGPGNDEDVETGGGSVVAVMGLVGAGAVIDPEYEQVPPDGLYQVEVPFVMPEGLIAFQVKGSSMLPKYEQDEVIVVWAEPRRPVESFYGQTAVVRTAGGARYLKKIMRGRSPRTVDLHSYDGSDPIENVRLEWIGQIFARFPASEIIRLEKQNRRAGRVPAAARR